LFWFWSVVAASAVAIAGFIGNRVAGPWGAICAAGLSSVSLPHLRLYTQFNQMGSAALFSLLLLAAGAWRAGRGRHGPSALLMGLMAFLLPFSDNMWMCTALSFPVYLWVLSGRPARAEFACTARPFIVGIVAALACMLPLVALRYWTGETVYSCTLMHFASRVVAMIARFGSPAVQGGGRMAPVEIVSLLGLGGSLAVLLSAAAAMIAPRDARRFALVPVALAQAVPLLFVSKGVTMVTEYFQHGLSLVVLATGVLISGLCAGSPGQRPSAGWTAASRGAAALCFLIMLNASARVGGRLRAGESGEAWATVGGRLARLPADSVIASTAEQEVGILYSGRRILTRNDTSAPDLLAALEDWPGRIDALVVRSSEADMFRALAARHDLVAGDGVGTGRERWVTFATATRTSGIPGDAPGDVTLDCRRQPYIPYYLDAGWRYPPQSLLRGWSTAALVSGDPGLWDEWSRATGLPHDRFAVPVSGARGRAMTKAGEENR
jgi:hypothetical protein